jgi:hypothetical protein
MKRIPFINRVNSKSRWLLSCYILLSLAGLSGYVGREVYVAPVPVQTEMRLFNALTISSNTAQYKTLAARSASRKENVYFSSDFTLALLQYQIISSTWYSSTARLQYRIATCYRSAQRKTIPSDSKKSDSFPSLG